MIECVVGIETGLIEQCHDIHAALDCRKPVVRNDEDVRPTCSALPWDAAENARGFSPNNRQTANSRNVRLKLLESGILPDRDVRIFFIRAKL